MYSEYIFTEYVGAQFATDRYICRPFPLAIIYLSDILGCTVIQPFDGLRYQPSFEGIRRPQTGLMIQISKILLDSGLCIEKTLCQP